MSAFINEYNRWLSSGYVSEEDKKELQGLTEDEIKARFQSELEFGTAGIRRKMEVGPGAINSYTVKHITRALAMYLTNGADEAGAAKQANLSVVIACDSRNNSQKYAEEAACVLAAQGIHVFLYEDLRPTPELSFAVRYSGAAAGINITASHNTKEYNGYKVYGPDGAQLSPEQADEIAKILMETDVLEPVEEMDLQEAIKASIVELIDGYVDNMYLAQVMNCARIAKALEASEMPKSSESAKLVDAAKNLKIVYTALHGTGFRFVPKVLERDGFSKVYCVEEQLVPDGNFPTVKSPNPENAEAFAMAMELAKEKGADLIIGTDPDGDRCGVAIPMAESGALEYKVLTGNQIGVLILDYLIKSRISEGGIPEGAYAAKSIVSTNLANRICEKHGVEMVETLTGFKFIGEKMEELSVGEGREFILGFEESNGYLTGLYARDKDAVLGSLLIAETAAYHAAAGRTMEQALNSLYDEYGYYMEKVISKEFTGVNGAEEMQAFMDGLRTAPPAEFAGTPVVRIRDYLSGEVCTAAGSGDASTAGTGLPKSNVLFYELADGGSLIVRPSGTEPKIKFYLSAVAESHEAALGKLEDLEGCL